MDRQTRGAISLCSISSRRKAVVQRMLSGAPLGTEHILSSRRSFSVSDMIHSTGVPDLLCRWMINVA